MRSFYDHLIWERDHGGGLSPMESKAIIEIERAFRAGFETGVENADGSRDFDADKAWATYRAEERVQISDKTEHVE